LSASSSAISSTLLPRSKDKESSKVTLRQIAPELARLHRQHEANGLALVMVGRGDAEENRKKARQNGFDFPIVLQKKWELSKQYGIFATPVAFLINEEGVIARDVATGADAILELAQHHLTRSHKE